MDLPAETKVQQRRMENLVERAFSFASLSEYSPWERFLIKFADLTFYLLIKFVGLTLRWKVEGEVHLESISRSGALPIHTFWHNQIFLATYFLRNRRMVVMTSRSFDGEYIARFIQRFGYGAARGSSTRGGIGAVIEMVKLMRAGYPTAITIDGPKGPRHVAKMGAVLLAKKTGNPVLPFSVTATKCLTINSWDRLQIPMPFTRALMSFAPPIHVPKDATEEDLQAKRDELQKVLDEMYEQGEAWRQT
jgi:lysophospholipid acyltransferase (LPLAT)-like uncharacterized protein